jgi:hypothetical protein
MAKQKQNNFGGISIQESNHEFAQLMNLGERITRFRGFSGSGALPMSEHRTRFNNVNNMTNQLHNWSEYVYTLCFGYFGHNICKFIDSNCCRSPSSQKETSPNSSCSMCDSQRFMVASSLALVVEEEMSFPRYISHGGITHIHLSLRPLQPLHQVRLQQQQRRLLPVPARVRQIAQVSPPCYLRKIFHPQ